MFGKRKSKKSERRGSAEEKNFVPNEISKHYLYKFPGSPKSPPAAVPKMVKIEMKGFSDEELEKRFEELANKKNWDEGCQWCEHPVMLHRQPCIRSDTANDYKKVTMLWREYKERMKPMIEEKEKEKTRKVELEIRKEMTERNEDKMEDIEMKKLAAVMATAQQPLVDAILKRDNKPATVMKAAKPPTWTKNMTLDMYIKAIHVWIA